MSKVLVLDGIQLVYDVSTFKEMNEQYDKLILVHKSNTPFNFSVSEVAQISQIIAQKKLEFFQVPNTFETESPKHDFNLALFYLLGYYDHPRHIQDQIAVNTLKHNLLENSFSWKNSDSAPHNKISNLNQTFGIIQQDLSPKSTPTQHHIEANTENNIEPKISNAVNEFDQKIIVDDRNSVLVDSVEPKQSAEQYTPKSNQQSNQEKEKPTSTPQSDSHKKNREYKQHHKPYISKQVQQKHNDQPLNLFDQSDESTVFDIDNLDDLPSINPYDEKQPTYNIDKNKIIPNGSHKKQQQEVNKHTVNPALSVFKETHTKEKFIQTLAEISENAIHEIVEKTVKPILANDNDQSYDGVFKSRHELYVVQKICRNLISQKLTSTTKSQLFSIINAEVLEDHLQEQNSNTIFSLMQQAGLVQNQTPTISVNRSIALFLISNSEPQIINDTLISYQTITDDKNYTDAIDFGYGISPNDSRIVSNLALLMVSKLNDHPNIFQPQEFRRIVGACFETIKIEELDFCYDLLKTRYKINPNEEYQYNNTAKLLRLSTVIRNTEEAKGIATTYVPPEQFNLTESINLNRVPSEPEQDFLQQQPIENTVSFQDIDTILNRENREFLQQQPIEEIKPILTEDEDTTNHSDIYFDHLKTVLESIQAKHATITHRDQFEKMMQRIFKKRKIKEDSAFLYQKMVDDWIVKIIDYDGDNEHIILSPMAIFIALNSPNADDYAFRVKKYKEVGILYASVKISRLESFKKALSSINRMSDDKRPKIIKGITTAINKKLNDEHETKMIIQSFSDKKIHAINGKRVVFNQDAIDYWSIRTDTEKQPD